MSFNLPKQSSTSKEKKPAIIPIPTGQQAAQILEQQNPVQLSTTPPTSEPVTLQFNRDICQAHLDKIAEFMEPFAGKAGMNPYMWITKFVTPLYHRMEGIDTFTGTSVDSDGNDIYPEQTAELQAEILALPLNEEPSTANIFKRRKLSEMKKAKVTTTNEPSQAP